MGGKKALVTWLVLKILFSMLKMWEILLIFLLGNADLWSRLINECFDHRKKHTGPQLWPLSDTSAAYTVQEGNIEMKVLCILLKK